MGQKLCDLPSASPPTELLDLMEGFLSDYGFERSYSAFRKHRIKQGWQSLPLAKHDNDVVYPTLVNVFQTWQNAPSKDQSSSINTKLNSKTAKTSSLKDSAKGSVRKRSAEAMEHSKVKKSSNDSLSNVPGRKSKRKASLRSSSSDSSSSSTDCETTGKMDDNHLDKRHKTRVSESTDVAVSTLGSPFKNKSIARATEEIDTASSTDSSSSGESSSCTSPSPENKPVQMPKVACLQLSEPSISVSPHDIPSTPDDGNRLTHGDATGTRNNQAKSLWTPAIHETERRKKQSEPFSRIPKDIKVDPKFASNAYVPLDYSLRAHEDLIVTKGKGFTKEKNKKKRGSYRGGMIDITQKKGIYFDD